MILYLQAEPPHLWALLDRRGRVVEDGVCDSPVEIPVLDRAARAVAVIPGESVTIHTIETPARSRRKALASAPYALEERLATNVDELVFTMLDFDPGRAASLAVVDKSYVEIIQRELAGVPLRLEAMVPEYFLVPLHHQVRHIIARMPQGRYALRCGGSDGMMLDEDTLGYWWQTRVTPDTAIAVNEITLAQQLIEWGGTSISVWEIGSQYPDWLRHGQTALERINVMGSAGEFEGGASPSGLVKAAAVLFGIGIAARVGVDLHDHYVLHNQNAEIEREIVRVFHEAFPDVRRIVNPRLQMEQRINQLRGSTVDAGALQAMLSVLAAAIPGTNATLDEIAFRGDSLLVTCTTADFAGLDRLKARFSEHGNVRVELMSSGSRDNKVSARFRLQLA